MAWWNDILGLLRDEVQALRGEQSSAADADLLTLKQAQSLLKRTTRELEDARARAEAARRRLKRAQADLEALTRDPAQHPRYRDRLVELSKVVAHESDLIASFDAHIARLDEIHQRIAAQLSRLARDLRMAETATASQRATQAVNPPPLARPKEAAAGKPGFRRQRPGALMEQLGKGPRTAVPDPPKSDAPDED